MGPGAAVRGLAGRPADATRGAGSARRWRGRWRGTGVAAVYASPLERARASAEVIAEPHRLPVRIVPAFAEMAFGAWEGLTRDEIRARFPEGWEQWRAAPHLCAPLGGETVSKVAERVAAGVAELQQAHADQTIVLVSHVDRDARSSCSPPSDSGSTASGRSTPRPPGSPRSSTSPTGRPCIA